LSATIFVTDLSAKPEMNKTWTEYFCDELPSRAAIGVSNLGPGLLIEVVVVASTTD